MAHNTLRLTILIASLLLPAACSAEERASSPAPSRDQAAASGPVASNERGARQMEGAMQIRIGAGARTIAARLEDSAAARDFAALLPIELTLKDYASTEKIADLPRKLSTQGAPAGADPAAGDIAYYAPWGNLTIYYRDFGYSRGLMRLGRIEGGVEALWSLEGPVTIESIETSRP
jgi:hypothetical protein